jgi:hypothetical protein
MTEARWATYFFDVRRGSASAQNCGAILCDAGVRIWGAL